ncbi:hypothetical protein BIW11_13929 [Tropilaelaps mercedesae]|uniref:Uncharacterized protein n=1 Tax=Tropilaelaps mercedesae TaxID=418985 RepID=A0A1V9X068_9ACAR|nr:hypothetical protein BIW11_13929 [Tropilaelaps mercedesae]
MILKQTSAMRKKQTKTVTSTAHTHLCCQRELSVTYGISSMKQDFVQKLSQKSMG